MREYVFVGARTRVHANVRYANVRLHDRFHVRACECLCVPVRACTYACVQVEI